MLQKETVLRRWTHKVRGHYEAQATKKTVAILTQDLKAGC